MNQHIETLLHVAVSAAADAKDASQRASELERRFTALSRSQTPQQLLADVAEAVARAVEESSAAQQHAAEAYRALSAAMPEGMTVKQWLAQKEARS